MQNHWTAQSCPQNYRYQPITTGQLRVAEIFPGGPDDPVAITLHHTTFLHTGGSQAPIGYYEALSYVWGSKEDPEQVFIDNSILRVTRNLSSALKHLRYRQESRYMWIDALCIDQQNEVEKGPCVAMMGDIYRRALRVVVWLGEEKNDSTQAMNLLKWVGERVDVDFFTMTTSPSPYLQNVDSYLADKARPLPFNEDQHFSIHSLFMRPWFERLWIRQEIYLANQESAVVICGHQTISWLTFKRAWACFLLKPVDASIRHYLEFTTRGASIRDVLFHNDAGFMPGLRKGSGHAQCSDPRDRIYALLNLEEDLQDIGIVPDYTHTKTHMDVYEDVARRYLQHFRGLDLLSECELSDRRSARNTGSSTPSWVPDWSTGNPYLQQINTLCSYTSGCLTGPKFPIQQNRLPVVAIPIDRIKTIRPHQLEVASPVQEIRSEIRDLVKSMNLNDYYRCGGSLLEALASTLCMGISSDYHFNPPQGEYSKYDAMQSIANVVQGSMLLPQDEYAHQESQCLMMMWRCLVGRTLFTTETGYIGLASSSAAPGDEVCVILGCSVAMVLRPSTENREEKLVVGPCYIEGFNDGEAVLGPLPNGRKRKIVNNGDLEYVFGDGEVIDPRLRGRISLYQADILRNACDGAGGDKALEVDLDFLKGLGVHNARYLYLV